VLRAVHTVAGTIGSRNNKGERFGAAGNSLHNLGLSQVRPRHPRVLRRMKERNRKLTETKLGDVS
jgi:hypothetical protein